MHIEKYIEGLDKVITGCVGVSCEGVNCPTCPMTSKVDLGVHGKMPLGDVLKRLEIHLAKLSQMEVK